MSQNIEENRKNWPKERDVFNVGQKEVDSQKIWEPSSDYSKGGQYGKVHGRTFRSGHSIEIDETDGGKRIRIIHANGSYVDMQDDGSTIYRSQGDNFEVVVGNNNVRVQGSCNVYINGDANVKVGGNLTAEVGGDTDITTANFNVNSESFTHNKINVGYTHVHGGVIAGGDDTSTPH